MRPWPALGQWIEFFRFSFPPQVRKYLLDHRRIFDSPLRNTERVLNNTAALRLLDKEQMLGDQLTIEDIIDEVAGVYPKIMLDGDMEAGVWSCGMVACLIDDVSSCQELIERIMSEADVLINQRLSTMVNA